MALRGTTGGATRHSVPGVVVRVVRRQTLESPVNPQVLRRHAPYLRLDDVVEALGVGDRVVGWKILERRLDGAAVAAAGQALEEIGQHLRVRHARDARGGGIGGGR